MISFAHLGKHGQTEGLSEVYESLFENLRKLAGNQKYIQMNHLC